ncbi:hypothetical protein HZB02_00235 [Candidatus Woesearchaeota archaeon]|nr:hypothetical protein [Candidatus Woesearchaeota archaeon]
MRHLPKPLFSSLIFLSLLLLVGFLGGLVLSNLLVMGFSTSGKTIATPTSILPSYSWQDVENPSYTSVFDIAQNKFQPSVLFLATSSGIYKSIDLGNSWVLKHSGAVHKIRFDPFRSNVRYAMNSSSFLRSDDFGNTWLEKNNGIQGDTEVGNGIVFADFALDPTQSNIGVLYASVSQDGIYKSVNSGDAWTKVSPAENQQHPGIDLFNQVLYSVAVDPSNSTHIIVGGVGPVGFGTSSLNGFFYETRDAGRTWRRIIIPSLSSSFLFSYSSPPLLLFSGNDGSILQARYNGTDYTFSTFINASKHINSGSLLFSEDDPQMIIGFSSLNQSLLVSQDFGKTFSLLSPLQSHSGQSIISFQRNRYRPNQLLIGTTIGFWVYDALTGDFEQRPLGSQGPIDSVGFTPRSGILLAQADDSVFYSTNNQWRHLPLFGLDTYIPQFGEALQAMVSASAFYGFLLGGDHLKPDAVAVYDFSRQQLTSYRIPAASGIGSTTPIFQTVFFGNATALLFSYNRNLLSTGIMKYDFPSGNTQVEVSSGPSPFSISVAGNTIYGFQTPASALSKRTSQGTWQDVFDFNTLAPGFNIIMVAYSASSHQTYVLLKKQSIDFRIYRMNTMIQDGISRWENIPIPPSSSVTAFFVDSTGRLWIGSQNGIFMSRDSGKTWTAMNLGLGSSNLWIASIAQHPLTHEIYIVANGKIKKLVEPNMTP